MLVNVLLVLRSETKTVSLCSVSPVLLKAHTSYENELCNFSSPANKLSVPISAFKTLIAQNKDD